MKIKKDFIGKRFGQLIIIDIYKKKGQLRCKCICDCGKSTDVYLSNILAKRTISCGHRMKEVNSSYKDILGKKYNSLTVIKKTNKRKYGSIIWKCKCDCGKEIEATKKQLDRGYIKHCKNHENEDIIGKCFGELTVISYNKKHNKLYCKCSCGNYILVSRNNLINGHTKSCGHLKNLSQLYKIDGVIVCRLKSKIPSNNKSGFKGVSLKNNGKWQAYITLKKKQYNLGTYIKKEDAIKARLNAEEKLFKPILEKYKTLT